MEVYTEALITWICRRCEQVVNTSQFPVVLPGELVVNTEPCPECGFPLIQVKIEFKKEGNINGSR